MLLLHSTHYAYVVNKIQENKHHTQNKSAGFEIDFNIYFNLATFCCLQKREGRAYYVIFLRKISKLEFWPRKKINI